ncbi:MAG: hypothetical protein DCO96_01990 [Fluviicola sp. XM-24bin1]|nr:MAG: hypothetical protein DCO96_01990 [Fluviicola sp. XM-24bin1]
MFINKHSKQIGWQYLCQSGLFEEKCLDYPKNSTFGRNLGAEKRRIQQRNLWLETTALMQLSNLLAMRQFQGSKRYNLPIAARRLGPVKTIMYDSIAQR